MDERAETQMIRLECLSCDMTALGVQTASFLALWTEHMGIHEPDADYRAWTWKVVPFPF